VEVKRTSLVWHYRNADLDLGEYRARRLAGDLAGSTSNLTVNIRRGRKIVEVGDATVSKGAAARRLLEGRPYMFVLAAGDDATDETLFHPPPTPESFTLKIGAGATAARHRIPTPAAFRRLLHAALDVALRTPASATAALSTSSG
jgi:trehalose 6-phosphate synthase/phosphatase